MTTATSRVAGSGYAGNPWTALWVLMIGFFMIMLDSTIVAIANPTIMTQLHIGYATVVWVTSAYLLGYVVPMLVAGRLGDRFGPRNLYLIGLAVFTVASLWCGLSSSAGMLIAARVLQGVGAGVLTPQTLSTITRIFPAHRRGAAMGAWGTIAGVGSLVGPLVGGALVDSLGWEWIFFVNLPVGVVGLVLAAYLIPALPTHAHQFDWFGVALSGAGMFLVVFGLQQGQSAKWEPWIWAVIVAGIGFMSLFIYWQARNTREPLIPLGVFSYRNFSLSNFGVAITAFTATGMMLPVTFYAQAVCGLSPTRTAVLLAPTAIVSGVLAPFVGMIVDRSHPLPVLGFGFSVLAISLTWLLIEMTPDTPIWRLVLPLIVLGVAMAFLWSPLTATATRNLPPRLAGASSGVFNAIRQLGAVLGSASMAAFMTSRIAAEMPTMRGEVDAPTAATGADAPVLLLPEFVREPFAAAMSQSMLLPAFIALFGIVAALFLVDITGSATTRQPLPEADGDPADDGYDDDDYVEYILRREPEDGGDTQPRPGRVHQPLPLSAAAWRGDPAVSQHRLPADVAPKAEPIRFADNGFRFIQEQRARNKHDLADPHDRGG
ncbi:MFS transporter [Mycobacterium decipiens]|uniref:MFS transporter n=2 Tax=Mycobacterium decipiens TaxID=1430326 RepID=A0A1X2LQN8_9MYCO|nr:MFS transporter [Mycobacterium decipiens]